MGYGTRGGAFGHPIQTYTPDNTPDVLYIEADLATVGLDELMNRIHDHFGEVPNLEDFTISAEHIHTDCLSYDRYDPGDHTNYIVITRNK